MNPINFNLRNIPPKVMVFLKKEAGKQQISVNSLILKMIEQSCFGTLRSPKKTIYHDLDPLAGTWSDEDKKTFDENIKAFENIDKELWS